MLKGKSLLDFTYLLLPNEFEQNGKIVLIYFQWILKRSGWKKCIKCNKYKKDKNREISYIFDKALVLFNFFTVNVAVNAWVDFRWKKIDEMRDYLSEEINLNEPISKKHKSICNIYLASAVTACISISNFASLFGILVGILSSADGLKICAITAEI